MDIDVIGWMSDALQAARVRCGPSMNYCLQNAEDVGGSAVLDVENDRMIGQLILWANGYSETTVGHVATEAVSTETTRVHDRADFDAVIRGFLTAVLEAGAAI